MFTRRGFLKLVIVGGAALSIPTAYSTEVEPKNIVLSHLNLDMGIGRRFIHISDTHFASSVYSVKSLMDIVEKMNPDFIVHTGDLITYPDGLEDGLKLLSSLSDVSDVFIVLGNHDHWSNLTSMKLKMLVKNFNNVYVLDNESVLYDGFWMVGVDDPYTGYDDLHKALSYVDDNLPKILLAHSPQIIGGAVDNVDVVLAGHTHGGQIRLPFIGPLWLPLPPQYKKYDYGLFKVSNTLMFVTRGVGTTFMPIRFNCPPEVVEFLL